MTEIQIFDAENIETLKWPETEEGELARRYLFPLIREGTESFISNAKTRLYIMTVDDFVIPITVNEKEYENSYLLSSYFAAANMMEKLEQASALLRFFAKPLVGLFGQILKWMKINKVVIINNWLFGTNLYPDLTKNQIKAITLFLKNRFPDHYLMFRSVNTYKNSIVFDGLNLQNFRMIPCRKIYFYDPRRSSELSRNAIRKQKKDKHLIAHAKYEVQTADALSEEEVSRILELYRKVYVSKYTKYSPLYTKKYVRQALKNKTLRFKLLKKNNQIYGVTGFLQKDGYLFNPFFGYDTSVPSEEGIYRMLSSIVMQEIEKINLVSHQGSGGDSYKKQRGCTEQQEYVAIYDHHLPFIRRLFWFLGEKFSSKFQY